MVTSEIYTKRLRPEHAQAFSRNSSRIMFVCTCRCADVRVCQKKKGGGGRPRERKEGGWGGERQRIFGDI